MGLSNMVPLRSIQQYGVVVVVVALLKSVQGGKAFGVGRVTTTYCKAPYHVIARVFKVAFTYLGQYYTTFATYTGHHEIEFHKAW